MNDYRQSCHWKSWKGFYEIVESVSYDVCFDRHKFLTVNIKLFPKIINTRFLDILKIKRPLNVPNS